MQQRFGHVEGHGHPLVFLLIVALVVVLVGVTAYLVVRAVRHPHPTMAPPPPAAFGAPRTDQALEVVRLRYARGEITRDDYVRFVADLGGPSVSTAPPSTTTAPTSPA